jgi:hypothetical protein
MGVAMVDGVERVLTSNSRRGPWCAGMDMVYWNGLLWMPLGVRVALR